MSRRYANSYWESLYRIVPLMFIVTREIEWDDKELPRFPAGYAIKRAKAINSLMANRDEVVSRVEAEVDMYMELCPDTDESEYSSASEAPDPLVRGEDVGGKDAAQVLNQGTTDERLTDEIPDAEPSQSPFSRTPENPQVRYG